VISVAYYCMKVNHTTVALGQIGSFSICEGGLKENRRNIITANHTVSAATQDD
jgi:hypothetical protein